MDTTIGNMVEAYLLDIRYKKFNKTAVKNLFLCNKKVLKEERDFVFLTKIRCPPK